MSLTLAAVGAVVAALFEVTVVPYLEIGGAHPHLVFVLGVVWTVVGGLDGGLTWAFFGGLALDVLAPDRALGSSAFALLLSVGGAAVISRLLTRGRFIVPVIAVFTLSFAYSTLLLLLHGALRGPVPLADPGQTFLPGAVYDAVLAGVIGPLAIGIHDRFTEEERALW